MAIFKCKMCGGSLEIAEGMTVCECEYCGTQQTLPKTDNEQALNMFNRANHFRQQCEFDKAAEIYERMTAQRDDAELYWSIVLCRYGIEYVDDPLTKKKIATCHRTQYKSILEDADYLEAINHADPVQREVYEREARYIDTVQKGILEISNKEEPFDVFICYKESDEQGRRTQDSVLAQELYYQLEREGFKVFFSRITLESKLGTEYEPYIFAALNSAKVMVVVGTKPEYFNAVWVKNEWSRYLMLMQEDRSRTLIPAYKDMDPYDLPDALSMFQAQDMSKLGFMQDLIRGISKIAKTDEPKPTVVKETVVQTVTNGNIAPLLKRAALFLEDSDWTSATEYCNKVLDQDPECAQAYFYMLLAELNLTSEADLESAEYENGIASSKNYKSAMRFGDDAMKQNLETLHKQTIYNYANSALEKAADRSACMEAKSVFEKITDFKNSAEKIAQCDEKANEIDYAAAFDEMQQASEEHGYKSAALKFGRLKDYKDSAEKVEKCLQKAEDARKDSIYREAEALSDCTGTSDEKSLDDVSKAKNMFESIPGWKDSDDLAAQCRERIKEIQAAIAAAKKEAERREKRKARLHRIIAVFLVLGIAGSVVTTTYIMPTVKYNNAVEELKNGNYDSAISTFESLNSFKDSKEKVSESRYKKALHLVETQHYDEAKEIFSDLGDYKDASDQIGLTDKEQMYVNALATYNAENYYTAFKLFTELENYKDSESRKSDAEEKTYNSAVAALDNKDYDTAVDLFKKLREYKDSADLRDKCYMKQTQAVISAAKVGDVVKFGEYEWYVIAKSKSKARLLSKNAICTKEHNHSFKDITWQKSSIRFFLNDDIYNSIFKDYEKKLIVKTECKTKDNKTYKTKGGKTTKDYIYLLSIEEAKKLDANILKCSGTTWWLRSPGQYQYRMEYVDSYGWISETGWDVDRKMGVRPTLVVKLK